MIYGLYLAYSKWEVLPDEECANPTGIHWAMTAFWQSIWTTVILIILLFEP